MPRRSVHLDHQALIAALQVSPLRGQQLASAAGVAQPYLWRVEHGRQVVTRELAVKLADGLQRYAESAASAAALLRAMVRPDHGASRRG